MLVGGHGMPWPYESTFAKIKWTPAKKRTGVTDWGLGIDRQRD